MLLSIEKKKTREKILRIAGDLMIQKGIDNTTLADIAKATNISKGTLYYYYSSKNDLIFDITDKHLNLVTELISSWLEEIPRRKNPKGILKFIFRRIVSTESTGKLHIYLIHEAISKNKDLKEYYRQKYIQWERMISNALSKILKKEKIHNLLAGIIMAVLDGFIIQSMLGVKKYSLDEIAEYLIEDI